MRGGALRILPFALISTVLHAVVLVGAAEQRLDFAVTPSGETGAVSVRLVAAGPPESGPASDDIEAEDKRQESSEPQQDVSPERIAAAPKAASPEPEPEPEPKPSPQPTPAKSSESAQEVTQRPSPMLEHEPQQPAPPKHQHERQPKPKPERQQQTDAKPQPGSRNDELREQAESNKPNKPQDAAKQTADSSPPAKPDAKRSTTERNSGAQGTADRTQLAQRARKDVAVRFRQQFRYPHIARQRGWEGRVVLAFRVHADGRITDIEVMESSGRAVLDQAARQSLNEIGRIPELANRLSGGPLELQVPVTYRLRSA